MKNIIILIVICTIMTSCGLFKSTFKHKTQRSEVVRTDITESRDSTVSKIDKSTIKTSTTTTVTEDMPEKKVSGQVKADKKGLQNGLDVIDSAGVTVKVYLDSATNMLKAMARISGGSKVTETKKEEVRNNDITEQSGSSEKREEKKQVAIESKEKTVERRPIKMGVFALIAVAAIGIISFFLWLYVKKKRTNP